MDIIFLGSIFCKFKKSLKIYLLLYLKLSSSNFLEIFMYYNKKRYVWNLINSINKSFMKFLREVFLNLHNIFFVIV